MASFSNFRKYSSSWETSKDRELVVVPINDEYNRKTKGGVLKSEGVEPSHCVESD